MQCKRRYDGIGRVLILPWMRNQHICRINLITQLLYLEQYTLGSHMVDGNTFAELGRMPAVLEGKASMLISPAGGVDALLIGLRASKVLGR